MSDRAAPVYLDWNATTPMHPEVLAAMERARERAWANPSSVHGAGRSARGELEAAREVLGQTLGFHPRDVLFTGSGTEANNLALHDAAGIVTSRIEHPSVVAVAEQREAAGAPVTWLSVGTSGRVSPEGVSEALERLSGPTEGVVVAVMAANHETGVLQPIREIAKVVHRAGARLHVDAVQLLGRGSLEELQAADTVAVAAHKVRGPKGIGALLWKAGRPPRPVLRGGAQERGLRPGTQDAVAATGFRVALERLDASRAAYAALAPERDRLELAISDRVTRNGDADRLPHVSNLSFTGLRGDEVVAALDLMGVHVSSGSACSAGTTEPSEVITAIAGRERAASAVRISLGEDTSPADVDRAIGAFLRVLA